MSYFKLLLDIEASDTAAIRSAVEDLCVALDTGALAAGPGAHHSGSPVIDLPPLEGAPPDADNRFYEYKVEVERRP